jgi:hypothetical protein
MNEKPVSRPATASNEHRSFRKHLKFNAWLGVATVTYLITLYLVRENPGWAPALKVAMTLLPILPGLLYLRMGLRLLRSMDELQQRIQFEAWLFAAIGTVVVGAIINVLNAHGIVWEKFPHGLEIGGTYLAMFFLWCMGIASANRRYR